MFQRSPRVVNRRRLGQSAAAGFQPAPAGVSVVPAF
jgi:hypothetical protein